MARDKKRTRRSSTGSSGSGPRSTASSSPVRAGRPEPVNPAGATASSAAPIDAGSAEAPTRRSDKVDWDNEYSYVIGDLKQMAVVTVGLFVAMIAIGFFI